MLLVFLLGRSSFTIMGRLYRTNRELAGWSVYGSHVHMRQHVWEALLAQPWHFSCWV